MGEFFLAGLPLPFIVVAWLAFRAWSWAGRWRVRVVTPSYSYRPAVNVVCTRWFRTVEMATVETDDADFEERLATALAGGRSKCSALNAARRK